MGHHTAVQCRTRPGTGRGITREFRGEKHYGPVTGNPRQDDSPAGVTTAEGSNRPYPKPIPAASRLASPAEHLKPESRQEVT